MSHESQKFFGEVVDNCTDREAMFYAIGLQESLVSFAGLTIEAAAEIIGLYVKVAPNSDIAKLYVRGMSWGAEASGIAPQRRAKMSGGTGRMN